jgi:Flp pilus assembly protein TadG
MTRRPARPRRGERGSAPIEFALAVGLLLLPIAALVSVFPTWVERQSMARVAAREAARAVVLADSWDTGVLTAMERSDRVAANHGVAPADLHVVVDGALTRGASVTATASVEIPISIVPGFGSTGGFTWTVTHTERVDDYRSLP